MSLKQIRTFNVTFVHGEFTLMTTINNANMSSVWEDTPIEKVRSDLIYVAAHHVQDNMPLAVQLAPMSDFLSKWADDIIIEEVIE